MERHYSLPLDGGGRGGGDFHASLCPFQGMTVRREKTHLTTDIERARTELIHKGLNRLSGDELIERVISMPDPEGFVTGLSSEDFYWLVKKVGEDDCLPLLELASTGQWQYLLDMELWIKDRLDSNASVLWLDRLRQADCPRLVKWLFTEGEYLAYHQFHKLLDVFVASSKDDVYDVPEGYFTIDGSIYIRPRSPDFMEAAKNIVMTMAEEDFLKYQGLFLGLTGFAPAEVEEEIYRLKNVRLAEHGFLPFDEALAVYAPLDIDGLTPGPHPALPEPDAGESAEGLIPVWPFHTSPEKNLLMHVIDAAQDTALLDRLRLEFAGLCNQILSADALTINDLRVLDRTSQKALSYINLAIQKLCGADILKIEKLLRSNPLMSLFRAGFGLAMKVRWEAVRWIKGSWAFSKGLKADFWGEDRGGLIRGLVGGRIPMFYTGLPGEKEFKDFEWIQELAHAMKALRDAMILDSLIAHLDERFSCDEKIAKRPEATFHPLIFNLWARKVTGLPLSLSGITLSQAKTFMETIRSAGKLPPFSIEEFKKVFLSDFEQYGRADQEAIRSLREVLSTLWEEFSREYEMVALEDITPIYFRFLTILPDQESAFR